MDKIRSTLRILLVVQLMVLFNLRFLGVNTHLDWEMLIILSIQVVLILPFEEFEIIKLIKGRLRRF